MILVIKQITAISRWEGSHRRFCTQNSRLHLALIFHLPYSAAAILRTVTATERNANFLLCFQCCPRDICRWIFAYMHVLHWCTTHSNCGQKILPFFKNILGQLILISTHFPVFFCAISSPFYWQFSRISVIQELRARKNGLIKRFSRVGQIITHSRESSNSQRDPQDHAHP